MIDRELLEYVDIDLYTLYLRQGQRIGQAWFNSLLFNYGNVLVGTPYDPFFVQDSEANDKLIAAAVYIECEDGRP